MDIQTLNKIESLVVAANRVQEFRPTAEPGHIYFLKHGDSLERKVAEPAVRGHTAASIDTVVFKAADTTAESQAEIWCDRDGVTLLLDGNRRDTVHFGLNLSEQIEKLKSMASLSLSQKDIIFTLRTTFADSLGNSELVPILRNVKFNLNQSGHSDLSQGKSSVGKEITAEVTFTKALPEYVTFFVPVFSQANMQQVRENVRCALEPDPTTSTFKLVALPGQIEKAIGSGENQVKVLIEQGLAEKHATHVKVFLGEL